jgi:hypothetical protein
MVPWNKPAIAKDTAKEPKITDPLGAFVRAMSIFDQMLRVVRKCAEARFRARNAWNASGIPAEVGSGRFFGFG